MADMWYYTTEGKQMDPVTMKELKRLVGDGTLKPTDMVWKDGMARWIRASSVKELFPDPMAELDKYFSSTKEAQTREAAASGVKAPPGSATTATASANGSVPATDEPVPQKKRPKSAADDDDDRGPPRRRSEAAKSGGGGMAITIFLILGVGVLMIALCGGVVILIVNWPSASSKGTPIDGQTNYNVQLAPGARDVRIFNFRKDVDYEIIVKTQPNQGVDVDLFVIHRNGNEEARDDGPAADCFVRWRPREDGDYRIEVQNVAGNLDVNSSVTIREVKDAPPNKDAPPKDQVKDAPPKDVPLPRDVLEGKGLKDVPSVGPGKQRTYKFRVKAGHLVSFRMTALSPPPNTVFQLEVVKEGDPSVTLAQDRPGGPNPSVTLVATDTEIVQVRVINASKKLCGGKLFYDVSPVP